MLERPMMTAVAAAASVPFSPTAMKALWMTSATKEERVPSMPEKSAAAENAETMPSPCSRAWRPVAGLDLEARQAEDDLLGR